MRASVWIGVVFGVLKANVFTRDFPQVQTPSCLACESKCRFKSFAYMVVRAVYFLFVVYSVQYIRLIKKPMLFKLLVDCKSPWVSTAQ